MAEPPPPLTSRRAVDLAIRLVALGIVVAWCLVIVRPFVEIVLWAVILAVALQQPFEWLSERLGGRPKVTALILTLVMLALVLGPISLLATQLVANLQDVVPRLLDGSLRLPPPPEGVGDWPLIGTPLAAFWNLASTNIMDAVEQLAPHVEPFGTVLLNVAAHAALAFGQVLVATILTGFVLVTAPPLAAQARIAAGRLVPDRGDAFVSLIGATTRGVANGVVGVALLQALLAGIGFLAAGIPYAGLITFAVLFLAIVQVGPMLVLVGTVIYAWWALDPLTALLFTCWMAPVSVFDNVLRPIMMARGLKVPIMVIVVGVVGGLVTHGLIGLFIGPVVLAIGYELFIAWIAADPGVPAADGKGHHAPKVPAGDTP